jgi:hypothetical protein
VSPRPQFQIRSPMVIHQTIDDEVIIINLDKGHYFSLSNAGVDIWELIDLEATLDQIVNGLVEYYEGAQDSIEAEVYRLLSALEAEELIAIQPAPQDSPSGDPIAVWRKHRNGRATAFVAPKFEKFSDMEEILLLDPIHDVDETGWPARKAD